MKSVILCEGQDDLWFIAYYLHKTAGWVVANEPAEKWTNYKISPLNSRQHVNYLKKDNDSAAIWCAGGKDSFERPVSILFDKFIKEFPFDPIDSVVIVRDRDNDAEQDILSEMSTWFPDQPRLENKRQSIWEDNIDGYPVSVRITPVVIPFFEEGAIETLLMNAVREKGAAEEFIVSSANAYIDTLTREPKVTAEYLSHGRLVLKARYAAVIAAKNPEHSTGLFQDMVMDCPWEKSSYVKEHFDIIAGAIHHQ